MMLGFLQNVGPVQLIIVILLICVFFGGKKIPELARSLRKAKGEFTKGLDEGEAELKKESAASEKSKGDAQ